MVQRGGQALPDSLRTHCPLAFRLVLDYPQNLRVPPTGAYAPLPIPWRPVMPSCCCLRLATPAVLLVGGLAFWASAAGDGPPAQPAGATRALLSQLKDYRPRSSTKQIATATGSCT